MTREELEDVIYERTRYFVEVRVMDCILELIAAEREAEREACAKVCEMQENRIVQTHPARVEFDPNSMMARKCAGAIRARGSK